MSVFSTRLFVEHLLARVVDRLAAVVTVEKLAVEQLHGNNGKDEMEQYVHNQYVYDVLQRINHAIEDRLELGHALDGLQGPQHSEHPERFDGRQIRTDGTATGITRARVMAGGHAQVNRGTRARDLVWDYITSFGIWTTQTRR